MKHVLMALLAVVLLGTTFGCQDKRNDDTGRGEKQDRIDTTTGRMPTK
jgi:hypothetical protein